MSRQERLFKAKVVPGKPGSGNLFNEELVSNGETVRCLGLEFENDEARRTHFTEELRGKLQEPEFRKIEGFPIGKEEDILKLSDPPYYTACPNPWIADFVKEWEGRKPVPKNQQPYHREPFATDVTEGKNDPIYNAHSYHTKVPHKAIMHYILHYTEPGDIVFDGFCGTGMTGVAAQMCGDRSVVESLGYRVDKNGIIYQKETDEKDNPHASAKFSDKKKWQVFSKLGARRAVLNDLSPAATFIAYNYNTPVDVKAFEREAKRILAEVEEECGWMYETLHTDGKAKGKINYTVWSDVFICPECTNEVIFWEAAVDKEAGKVNAEFPCPHCGAELTKRRMERAWTTRFDTALNESMRQAKQVPVLINYTLDGVRGRSEKTPDEADLALMERIENSEIPYWFPTDKLPDGYNTRQPINSHGITHVHHFYTKRNLICLATFWRRLNRKMKWISTSFLSRNLTKCNRYVINSHNPNGRINGPLTGTFYIPSEMVEQSAIELFAGKILKAGWITMGNIIQTSSTTKIPNITSHSIDYLFFDPPFGSNIMYSELSFLWESWLSIITNNSKEAIENDSQHKTINDYRKLIVLCFKEAYRVLKPGRWMTVEFSNTRASVWNSIQTAIAEAGFIVGNVSILDKKHGGVKAMTNLTNVKQDLVISAYKPNGGFEERFKKESQTEEAVWDFVRTHLKYLPVVKKQGGDIITIPERDPRILYDQMLAYYVRRNRIVPIDSQDFQLGLPQRFVLRDGMIFLLNQVAKYDREKMLNGNRTLQPSLFVSDEESAIAWLRNLLRNKPQNFQSINPQFMQEISGWSKNEVVLELSTLLEQNFLSYDGKDIVPSQIHAYLSSNWPEMRNLPKDNPALIAKAKDRWYVPDPNKAGDLEKLREKVLLKEFEEYKQAGKRLKTFRMEAVRAGFKKAYLENNYALIITVAEKIPAKTLEEDPKLIMWYDQAITRLGDSSGGLT